MGQRSQQEEEEEEEEEQQWRWQLPLCWLVQLARRQVQLLVEPVVELRVELLEKVAMEVVADQLEQQPVALQLGYLTEQLLELQ